MLKMLRRYHKNLFLVALALIFVTNQIGTSQTCPPSPCVRGRDVGPDFFVQVLQGLGIPPSEFAIRALQEWQRWENTAACWNPLATTRKIPGWLCNFNSVGVQHYADQNMGVRATIETLALSYYPAIRTMLACQGFDHAAIAQNLRTWGTCSDCTAHVNIWWNLYQQYCGPTCPPPNCTPGKAVGTAFFEEVLRRLGIPVNPMAIEMLRAWQQDKQSNDCWNPLETTRPLQGCTTGARARHFQTRDIGIQATVETLNLPYYAPIRALFAQQPPDWGAVHAALRTWGGCSDGTCQALLQQWQQIWARYHAPTPTPSPVPTPTPPPPPSPTPTLAAPPPPSTCPDGQFRVLFFNNPNLSGLPTTGMCTPTIDFIWHGEGPQGVPWDWFSTLAETRFFTETSGTFTYWLHSDDGHRLLVDGQIISDEWRHGQPLVAQGSLRLSPGWHTIRIEHYEAEGWAALQFTWGFTPDPPTPTATPLPSPTPIPSATPVPVTQPPEPLPTSTSTPTSSPPTQAPPIGVTPPTFTPTSETIVPPILPPVTDTPTPTQTTIDNPTPPPSDDGDLSEVPTETLIDELIVRLCGPQALLLAFPLLFLWQRRRAGHLE